jgi:hypothetical protein
MGACLRDTYRAPETVTDRGAKRPGPSRFLETWARRSSVSLAHALEACHSHHLSYEGTRYGYGDLPQEGLDHLSRIEPAHPRFGVEDDAVREHALRELLDVVR